MDAGVFIRSMASRGSHGGIARAAVDACDVMDAFGFSSIRSGIETVFYTVTTHVQTRLDAIAPLVEALVRELTSSLDVVSETFACSVIGASGR